ncbi:MAG: hypothetical protein ABIQ98_07410 [Sphingomicrobium sp.]
MANHDDGRGPRPGSARARSLMAAASLLGLSLGVSVANAAEDGAVADVVKPPVGEATASDGNFIKLDSSQIKGESADAPANHIKWNSIQLKRSSADAHHIKLTSDQIKGADRSAHTIKMDSSQIKGESTDGVAHQIKLKGE